MGPHAPRRITLQLTAIETQPA